MSTTKKALHQCETGSPVAMVTSARIWTNCYGVVLSEEACKLYCCFPDASALYDHTEAINTASLVMDAPYSGLKLFQ